MLLWNALCFRVNQLWAPPWERRTGLVAPLLLVCDVSVASYSFFFFFFLLQIFYPFKANSLSSGWGVLSREASEKAELVHQALSPLSRRSGLSSEQGWALLADKRTDVIVVVGESRCVPQKELGIPMPCGHNLIAAPIAKFWGLSVALSPYIVKKQNKTKFQVFKIFLIFSDRSLFTCIINHYLLR